MLSWKYSQMSGRLVCEDMDSNHGVSLSKKHLVFVCTTLGVRLREEELVEYALPEVEAETVASIGISCDGTTVLLHKGGYREAMVGTISLYDKLGERLTSSYLACAPETGKETFYTLFSDEIQRFQNAYPTAISVGIADGAACNWTFLNSRTEVQITDFYHATTYIAQASEAMFEDKQQAIDWRQKACHKLKHNKTGHKTILREMKKSAARNDPQLQQAITYFTNQAPRMHYLQYRNLNYPIGSGVTEAACKTLVKQRLCQAGMRWTTYAIDDVLLMRGLIASYNRWEQFWKRIIPKKSTL